MLERGHQNDVKPAQDQPAKPDEQG